MSWRAVRVAVVCVASLASANDLDAAKGDPVVRLIEPERGERRFVAPATIPLEAQAQAAPQRSIVRVEFFSGETLIGATSAVPHAITWSNVPEGEYRLRVRATDDTGATDWSPFVRVRVRANREPRVRLTEPAQDAQLKAQEIIVLSAAARDRDHNLSRVEFYADGILVGTVNTEPYRLSWGPVPAGDHILTAKAIDALGATDESRPIRIHVTAASAVAKLYFVHVDHLDTPRLIADDQQRTVWKWDHQEPFGVNAPDENPSGLGAFEFPARFPGQYFDKETNLHYNFFRDYDPSIGRYVESDPIGLEGGLNTYAYSLGSPLANIDFSGLDVRLLCRPVQIPFKEYMHCFVYVTCPEEGWRFTLSLFGNELRGPTTGDKAWSLPGVPGAKDDPTAGSRMNQYNKRINPTGNCNCGYERSVIGRFSAAPQTLYYGYTYSNSNTFAQYLITSQQYGTSLPPDVPTNAPGFNR